MDQKRWLSGWRKHLPGTLWNSAKKRPALQGLHEREHRWERGRSPRTAGLKEHLWLAIRCSSKHTVHSVSCCFPTGKVNRSTHSLLPPQKASPSICKPERRWCIDRKAQMHLSSLLEKTEPVLSLQDLLLSSFLHCRSSGMGTESIWKHSLLPYSEPWDDDGSLTAWPAATLGSSISWRAGLLKFI